MPVERVIVAGNTPLQLVAVVLVVMAGAGLTLCVIGLLDPTQPAVAVGITLYTIDPTAVLLGLVRVWAIVLPAPPAGVVRPPVLVPSVHVKLLGVLAVRLIAVG